MHERSLFACYHGADGLDLELDEPNGAAIDAGDWSGLYDFHSTGLAPAWWRSKDRPAFRGARIDALRRDGSNWFRFARHVQQSGHGEPGPGVRGGHRR